MEVSGSAPVAVSLWQGMRVSGLQNHLCLIDRRVRLDAGHHPFSEASTSIPRVDHDIGDPREDRVVGHRSTKPDLLVGVQERKAQGVLDHLGDHIPWPTDTPIGFRQEIKGAIHIDPASIVCDNKVFLGPFHRGTASSS
jgi:hypothetical protein